MTETPAEIAARYGAVVKPDLQIQYIAPGVSGMVPLVWDERREKLLYATKPDLQRLSYSGRKPVPVTVDGRTWRSMGELARYLGVTLPAVSRAVKRGTVAAMVARHAPKEAA